MILCPWSRDEAENMTAKSLVKTSEKSMVMLQRTSQSDKRPFEIKGTPLPPWVEKDRESIKVQRGNWIPPEYQKVAWENCSLANM